MWSLWLNLIMHVCNGCLMCHRWGLVYQHVAQHVAQSQDHTGPPVSQDLSILPHRKLLVLWGGVVVVVMGTEADSGRSEWGGRPGWGGGGFHTMQSIIFWHIDTTGLKYTTDWPKNAKIIAF